MGKNVEIKNPASPMSDRQSYCIYSLTGVDVREIDMTKQQASDVIDAINGDHAYHVRLKLAQNGGRVARKDVHKNFRSHSKPKGYVTAMKQLTPEPEPKEKKKPKEKKASGVGLDWLGKQEKPSKPVTESKPTPKPKKKAAKITGLEDVDFTDPQVIRIVQAFKAAAANG
jgi:hypothetical protein